MSDADTIEKALTNIGTKELTILDIQTDDDDDVKTIMFGRTPIVLEHEASGPRQHTFFAARGFIEYLVEYGTETTVVLADPETNTISAVLTESHEKAIEIVEMKPYLHPLWKPWDVMLEKAMLLPALLEFIRNVRRTIKSPDAKALVLALSQVKMATKVELFAGTGNDSMNGLMVTSKIRGKAAESEDAVDLPDSLILNVPIFLDTEARDIEIELIIEGAPDGTAIVARFASGDILTAKVEAFQLMVDTIFEELNTAKMTCAYGAPKYGKWEYQSVT